jgi:alpha-tubulin suppressor-like RCC1 family protein
LPATRLDGSSILQLTSGPMALHACALSAGSLTCWGANPLGELGDGTSVDRGAPTLAVDRSMTPLLGSEGSIALGKAHTCAIAASGALYCWGANQRHQLGALVASATAASPTLVY